jgi:benzodiazapine receptor
MSAGRGLLGLVGWVVLCFAAAAIGANFAPGTWYAALAKPPWNPPNWIFGPVWTTLYLLMGVAAWLVWRAHGPVWALGLFVAQLLLNAAWSWLFFGRHRPDLALLDIAALWLAIAATVVAFWRVRPLAGALLLPYLAWVSFAVLLNAEIWRRNPL